MIAILKQWDGKFEIDGEIYDSLDDIIDLKDGDSFQIKLLKERDRNAKTDRWRRLNSRVK